MEPLIGQGRAIIALDGDAIWPLKAEVLISSGRCQAGHGKLGRLLSMDREEF